MPDPDDPCFTVLPSGAICGHRYGRHFGLGPCLAGTSSGEASVCACLKFVSKEEADHVALGTALAMMAVGLVEEIDG